jgi:multidrug resistance efflux pump
MTTRTDSTPAPKEGSAMDSEQPVDLDEPADEFAAAASPAPGKRGLKRRTRISLIAIGVVALVVAVSLVASWLINSSTFVTTDNAQVDGTQILVNAPTSGTLTNWNAQLGTELRAGESVGRIAVQTGYMQPQMPVRAPADGVVAVNNGVNGAYVTAGSQLAIAYDESAVFVTARVNETDIQAVHLGQVVDLSVDAFPGTVLTGRVVEVKTGAAGMFSLFGQSNTTGNFQKVTQVIPVKISIDDRRNLALVPGMNVTAKIHRR